jgi:ParB family chromosome partitioning protein
MSTTVTPTNGTTAGTLEHLDPKTLTIGTNVRLDPRLDKAFLASIKQRGVLIPIVAYRDGDQVIVDKGQRRALAAVHTGRQTVPVLIVDVPGEADRIIDQYAENAHRAALNTAEEIAVFEQLAAIGLSPANIAKNTAQTRRHVDAALSASQSELAKKAAQRWDFLTLEHAAVLAEFEGDQDAVKQLVQAAQRGQFAHTAQQLRDDRAEQAAYDQAANELTSAGITLIGQPSWDDKQTSPLTRLTHDGSQLNHDNHHDCPGHAAYLSQRWIYQEDAPDIEEDEGHGPQAHKGEEQDAAAPQRGWVAVYVCINPAKYGHTDAQASRPQPKRAADMTDTERRAARSERHDVIQSNKAWDSAQTVRREWLKTFLTRKNAPKGTAAFMAQGLTRAEDAITKALDHGNHLARELFGLTGAAFGRRGGLAEQLTSASETRAQVIALGVLLAAYEENTGRHSWRHIDEATQRYLLFLHANGYELSTVERRACGQQLHTGQPGEESER